ncbi:MAG: Smr/MutS family protein [Pseudomonadota bacterium]|nr:Smr/MutS family protein [Pseudomonadota bacterium]
MASVKPLRGVTVAAHLPDPPQVARPVAARRAPAVAERPRAIPAPTRVPTNTLDGGWDKRIAKGMILPDSSIDLHGETLASAHALLDQGLDRAIQRGDRVLLLVTGKPPRPESERPHARGAIRAAVADWIGSSRHADRIAAIRGAHPRHGGQGALYLVLRRGR